MQENIHLISRDQLQFEDLHTIVLEGKSIKLSSDSIKSIVNCRTYLDEKVARTEKPIYGVNTGFGSLCDHSISEKDLSQLQANLMMSHACGTGDEVPHDLVKLMLLLKVQSLSYGHSGVQLITVQRLVAMYNNNILPIVYQQGSLGASGDLAPLAHLAL
ncbi:aromatic amino acid ammonia-lyase, partial [bacterium]|nr:aromatic amino acid ammonia-lyase [bacterium]